MYYPFRQWFLERLKNFEFPLWNPYWGAGHEAVIWATVPMDPYTILEIILGPHYYAFFHLVQCMALVLAGYYVFRKFEFDPWVAVLGSLFFFMSPLVTYWYFHFVKTNLFIAHMLMFLFMIKWFETGRVLYILLMGWSFFFGMFGTKLEFWFFEVVFFTLTPAIAFFVMKPKRASMVVVAWASILVATLAQLWQMNLLVGAVNNSNRLAIPHGLQNLFSSEMYKNLYLSLGDSDLPPLLLICALLFAGLHSKSPYRRFFLGLGLLVALLFRFWSFTFLSQFLKSPVLLGALLASVMILRIPSRKYLLSTWILFMLPAYYWCKPLVNNDETYLLREAPMLFQGIWGFLVWLGCFQVHRHRIAQLAYLSILVVFLLETQGQIVLAYLFGYLWLPGRDNYLIDFSFALLAVFGMLTYFQHQPLLVRLAPFIIAFSSYPNLYYMLPLEPVPGYANPLLNFKLPYDPFTAVPGLREVLRKWDYLPYRRVVDPDIENRLPQNQGTFLLEHTGNATFYGSMIPARYNELINFHRYGIVPQDKVAAYSSTYSEKTISRLPKVNTKGYTNGVICYAIIWTIPPFDEKVSLDLFRLLGIDYVVTRSDTLIPPLVQELKLRNITKIGEFNVAELSDTLPRTFLVTNVGQENLQHFQEDMRPHIELESGKTSPDSSVYIAEPARFLKYEPEYVAIQTESSAGGYLVLTDVFHPYWSATVDGSKAEIIPAFHAFRAVKVPAGSHKVEFFCRVPYFKLAFLVSLSVIAISSVLTFRFWNKEC